MSEPARPRAARRRQARLAITAVILSFTLSMLVAELLLRVTWRNPYVNETPDHLVKIERNHLLRDLEIERSILDAEHPRVRYRTNARSYITPSQQFENPQATVAFLGASTTANNAVKEELRFPALVSTLLAERGLRVNTLNAGKSGITSQDSINLLFNHVVFDEPDIAVMMHAHNDIGRLSRNGDYAARRGGPMTFSTVMRWALQRGSINSSLIGVVRNWQSSHALRPPKEYTRPTSPAASRSLPTGKYIARLKSFVGICRAFGITPVLMTQPATHVRTALTPDWTDPRNQEIFNHLVRQVGAEEDVLVIDLVQFFLNEVDDWNEPMVVFYDGVHFTDRGSQLAAIHIANRLYETVLQPRLAGAD